MLKSEKIYEEDWHSQIIFQIHWLKSLNQEYLEN